MDCIAKGKKEGKNANFMVAISHDKGNALSKQYFGAITGGKIAEIIYTEFMKHLLEVITLTTQFFDTMVALNRRVQLIDVLGNKKVPDSKYQHVVPI